MKTSVYNQEGKVVGEAVLPDEIFNVPMNADLVHQIFVSQAANQRQGSAHTKDRAEVSGGGRKPWKQKGTGRARHSSIRSPIWRGGGIVFGPRSEKGYEKQVPKKMRRKALFMVLSDKIRKNHLIVLDSVHIEKPSTKKFLAILNALPCGSKKALVALPSLDKTLLLSGSNIPSVETIQAKDLNLRDLMASRYLLLFKDSVAVIQKTFRPEGKAAQSAR